MFGKVIAITTCLLTISTAIPTDLSRILERQLQPKYPDNGTLTDPPPVTDLTRQNPTYTKEQLSELKGAYTAIERLALLKSYGSPNDYFKFDLTPNGSESNAANGLGGQGYLAQVSNYPVLIGTGISVAIGYLNPCGLDSVHIHNRAHEVVTLVAGKSLKTGFVLEDGFGKNSPISKHAQKQSIDSLQIWESTPKSASIRPQSVHKAHSTGSSTTIANPPSSSPRSPAKILV